MTTAFWFLAGAAAGAAFTAWVLLIAWRIDRRH